MKRIITLLFSLAVLAVLPLMAQGTATISSSTFASSEGGVWNFNDGWTITNSKPMEYAATGEYVKYNRNLAFTITVPEGKSITAITFTGYCNKDGQTAFIGQLGEATYEAVAGEGTNYFPSKGTTNTFTITPESALSGDVVFKVSGDNQVAMTMEIAYTGGTTGIVNVPVKDENRIVNVYSAGGQLVKSNVAFSEAGSSLPKGIYIVEGEKVVVK